jgi:hypothetical protein
MKTNGNVIDSIDDGPYDTFFLAFIGELVEMVIPLSDMISEGTITTKGYLLDYNDEYYFLGETPDEISHCVPRHNPKPRLIQVLSPENEYQEILEEMEVPKNEREKN